MNFMNRPEAQTIVDGVTFQVNQFAAVSVEDARRLLGEKHFDRLVADRVRGLGPESSAFYPWNVVDYLVVAENEKQAAVA
jgi:hypothetical protein